MKEKPMVEGARPDPMLYVVDSGGNLCAYDSVNLNQSPQSVAVGNGPTNVVASPDGRTLFVANQGDGTVSVVDAQSMKVITTLAVGGSPAYLAVSPGTGPKGPSIYVANCTDPSISVIDASTLTVTDTIPIQCDDPNGVPISQIGHIAITSDKAKLFVTCSTNSCVLEIDTATKIARLRKETYLAPQGVSVDPTDTYIYVCNTDLPPVQSLPDNTIVQVGINTAQQVYVPINVCKNPSELALSAEGGSICVISLLNDAITVKYSNTISVVGNVPGGQLNGVVFGRGNIPPMCRADRLQAGICCR
jgi:YVTN family beta-propeller protein